MQCHWSQRWKVGDRLNYIMRLMSIVLPPRGHILTMFLCVLSHAQNTVRVNAIWLDTVKEKWWSWKKMFFVERWSEEGMSFICSLQAFKLLKMSLCALCFNSCLHPTQLFSKQTSLAAEYCRVLSCKVQTQTGLVEHCSYDFRFWSFIESTVLITFHGLYGWKVTKGTPLSP